MDFSDFLLKELFRAYYEARLGGKRKTLDEHEFEVNDIENVCRLRDAIMARAYHPSRGVAFIVDRPVTREIFAAPFVDRVVHHLLYNFAVIWWEPRFCPSSYSCRKGRGTLYAIKDLQRKMRRVSRDGTVPAFVVKRDLRGYFMSLDHQKLFDRVAWGLERQFPEGGELYRTLKYLWHEVIFDDPTRDVRFRGKKSDWDKLPPDKSLLFQPKGRGIVIGNLTSQLLSNIYLDQLDRYVTLSLGYKNYGRYVDDFFVVVTDDELAQLLDNLIAVEDFLDDLGLVLHPKKCYQVAVRDGAEFLGARVFVDHILPGKRLCRNFDKAVYRFATTGQGDPAGLVSYDGHLMHFDSHKLAARVFDRVGWDYNYPKKAKKWISF